MVNSQRIIAKSPYPRARYGLLFDSYRLVPYIINDLNQSQYGIKCRHTFLLYVCCRAWKIKRGKERYVEHINMGGRVRRDGVDVLIAPPCMFRFLKFCKCSKVAQYYAYMTLLLNIDKTSHDVRIWFGPYVKWIQE